MTRANLIVSPIATTVGKLDAISSTEAGACGLRSTASGLRTKPGTLARVEARQSTGHPTEHLADHATCSLGAIHHTQRHGAPLRPLRPTNIKPAFPGRRCKSRRTAVSVCRKANPTEPGVCKNLEIAVVQCLAEGLCKEEAAEHK